MGGISRRGLMEHSLLLSRGRRLQQLGEIGIAKPAWFCCFRELLRMVAGASWPQRAEGTQGPTRIQNGLC